MKRPVCLITGATDGVGKVTALELAKNGFTIVVAARSANKAEALKREIEASTGSMESVRTPIRTPRANAIAERVVRSLRQECLDHILPLSEGHLRSVLAEFVSYYNQDRPHRSLGLETPVPSPRPSAGEVLSRPVLNGLQHVNERAA